MMSAEERSDRRQTALRATPCNRKQQWGELQKKRKSKTSYRETKKKSAFTSQGRRKTEEAEG